jgi:anti-sigma regulatory factor (Ser/Thr protein kinase)
MRIEFTVRLPVDSASIPFVRGLFRKALEHMQVGRDTIEEIVLALNEACANVVQHVGEHDDYEVHVDIDEPICRISVIDQGDGFDPDIPAKPVADAAGGQGLLLMRALVDDLHFLKDPAGRHTVTLEKRLDARPTLHSVPD